MKASDGGVGNVALLLVGNGRRIRVTANLVRAARMARTAGVVLAPETEGISLGVSLAATVLLFALDAKEEDCALKPGENILDRFIDRSRLERSGYLDVHEGRRRGLGHTLEEHVVQEEHLLKRLSAKYQDVSSFDGQPTAERVVREAVIANLWDIAIWASCRTKQGHEAPLEGKETGSIGFGFTLDSPRSRDQRRHALVVLRQREDCSIYILTAYPTKNARQRIQEEIP